MIYYDVKGGVIMKKSEMKEVVRAAIESKELCRMFF